MKALYEIATIGATPETFTKEGYNVISFGMVKAKAMEILGSKEIAERYHLYNNITGNDPEMETISEQLQRVVFKESRGSNGRYAIGWESLESYLRYHSGIIYKWYA